MAKHLSYAERCIIEKAIINDESFASIARRLNRSTSTIIREIKERRGFSERWTGATKNDCTKYPSCLAVNLCPSESIYSCHYRCKLCTDYDCRDYCKNYESKHCSKLDKAPYVCSNCHRENKCKKTHAYYTAHRANSHYEKERSNCRKGLRTSPERLAEIGAILSPLIKKGQSINQIMATHSDEIGLSEKTIYNYIDSGAFTVKNIDLPKKVVYRQRRKKQILTKIDYAYRHGRTYEDFKAFMEQHPDCNVIEMDTVKSSRGSKKTLLTLIFTDCSFMLVFLLPDATQAGIIATFDFLTDELGLDTFRKLFPVILTDNGVEFKCADQLEYTSSNVRRTNLFFCDPQASWQKPHVEKSHTLIRRILPKKTSFSKLTSSDISLITRHINSVPREIFNNKTPFELVSEDKKKLLELLTLTPVPADEVILKPALLNLKSR